jgi:outer membrane protein
VAQADLRLEVTRAYWGLVTAQEAENVLQEALDRAEAHLRDVKSMFETGLIPPNDVSLVESQRSRQQMQLIEAQNLRRGVAEDLKRLTGLAAETDLRPPQLPPSLPGTSVPPASELVNAALKQRGERQALAERVDAAEARQDAAAASRKPTIAFTGGVDYANPNPRIFPRANKWRESWDFGVNVSVPLWDAGRSKAETAEAAAAARALRERLADLDGLIAVDVRQRQFDIDSANAAIAAAEDAVRSAQEARRVVAERFRVGVATSTDVLDAQVALLQAQLDRTRGVANLRLAHARLDRALGR